MIRLPPQVFDILDASVSTYGLRAGRYFTFACNYDRAIPACLVGHWDHCFGNLTGPRELYGITEGMSDRAIYAINKRKHLRPTAAVSWLEFIHEMGIVCGQEQSCDLSAHESSMGYNDTRGFPDAPPMEGSEVS